MSSVHHFHCGCVEHDDDDGFITTDACSGLIQVWRLTPEPGRSGPTYSRQLIYEGESWDAADQAKKEAKAKEADS